jgi:hypothetical protein
MAIRQETCTNDRSISPLVQGLLLEIPGCENNEALPKASPDIILNQKDAIPVL